MPRVVLHNAVSLDNRLTGFGADIGKYYELSSVFKENATLVGSGTVLAAPDAVPPEDETAFIKPTIKSDDTRPLLVVPDSRGRIRSWHYLRKLPYWRDVLVLCSRTTPKDYLDYLSKRHIDYFVDGDDRVDLKSALDYLNARYGIQTVRADSGGTLNGVLLSAGLVNEISLLVHPALAGETDTVPFFRRSDALKTGKAIGLKLTHSETIGNLVWLRYDVLT